jgi:hypothetical protein
VLGEQETLLATFVGVFGAEGSLMTTMNTFKANFATVTTNIVSHMHQITTEAQNASNALSVLAAAQNTSEGAPATGVQPEGMYAGGKAKEGVPVVVGDGVGPELFVPPSDGQIVPGHSLRTGQQQAAPQYNTIVFNGVSDVDEIIYELKRRGVRLK